MKHFITTQFSGFLMARPVKTACVLYRITGRLLHQQTHETSEAPVIGFICSSALSSCTGKQFWVFKDTVLQSGYPKDITQFAPGMPAQSFEAVLWWEDVAKTYFFKGERYV